MASIFVLTLGSESPCVSETWTATTSRRMAPRDSLCGAPRENAVLIPLSHALCDGEVMLTVTPARYASLHTMSALRTSLGKSNARTERHEFRTGARQ